MTTGKTITLTRQTFVGKVMSLLSADEWIKMWYRETTEYYSAINKNETISSAAT